MEGPAWLSTSVPLAAGHRGHVGAPGERRALLQGAWVGVICIHAYICTACPGSPRLGVVCESYQGSSGRLSHSCLGGSVPSQCGPFLLWRQQGTWHSWPQQRPPCLPPPQAQGWAWQCPCFPGTRGAYGRLLPPGMSTSQRALPPLTTTLKRSLYGASQLGTWPASLSSPWQPRGQGLPHVTGEGTKTWRGEGILQNRTLGTRHCPSCFPSIDVYWITARTGGRQCQTPLGPEGPSTSLFSPLQPGPP